MRQGLRGASRDGCQSLGIVGVGSCAYAAGWGSGVIISVLPPPQNAPQTPCRARTCVLACGAVRNRPEVKFSGRLEWNFERSISVPLRNFVGTKGVPAPVH